MKKNVLTVTVEGRTGSGKSVITQIIAEALFAQGFEVSFSDLEHKVDLRTTKALKVALGSIRENTQVHVRENRPKSAPPRTVKPDTTWDKDCG